MTVTSALEQLVRSIPLFQWVDAAEVGEIAALLKPVDLTPGDILFRQGEPGAAMWLLGAAPEVTISTVPPGQARPVAVAYARAGEVVGEMALIDDGPRSATAVVTAGGLAHRIDTEAFNALRSGFRPAAFKVLRRLSVDLCKRLRATNERIVPSGKGGVETAPLMPGLRPNVEMLEAFPAFATLPQVVRLALSQKLELFEFPEITPLFAEGEESDGAWFLVSGEVSVGRNGKTLANLGPGSVFGIVSAIDSGTRSASCLTTGPAVLFRLKEKDFDALFAAGNRFAFQLVDLVARQLVAALRHANTMVPLPGGKEGARAPAASPSTVTTMLQAKDDAVLESDLPEIEVLAAEYEVDLSFAPLSEALG